MFFAVHIFYLPSESLILSHVQLGASVSSHKQGFHWLATFFWPLHVGLKLISGRAAVRHQHGMMGLH